MQEEYGTFSDSMINVKNRNDRAEFYGLAQDVSLLPTTDEIASGSVAYCVDTGDIFMYLKATHTWYPQ